MRFLAGSKNITATTNFDKRSAKIAIFKKLAAMSIPLTAELSSGCTTNCVK